MSLIPTTIEATVYALIGMEIFSMPIELSYTMGFAIGPVATGIVAPLIIRLNDMGFGREKGIAMTIIASCIFDNIFNLLMFGIMKTVTF